MGASLTLKQSGIKPSEIDKLAAGLTASPELSLAASATAAALGQLMQPAADDQLAMTGEALRQDADLDQESLAGVFSADDLGAAIQSHDYVSGMISADEPLLLAQARGNSDAGGGLVSQEDDEAGAGGNTWAWALGALALGLAAGGGGGDTIKEPDLNFGAGNGFRVSWSNGGTQASPQSGYEQLVTVSYSSIVSLTLDIDGVSVPYEVDGTLNRNAQDGYFEYYFGKVLGDGRTFQVYDASTNPTGNNAILITFDPTYNNIGDYGFVVSGVSDGSSFLLENYRITLNGVAISVTTA